MSEIAKPKPYVGIAGLGSHEEYRMLRDKASNILKGTDRFIMASILACEQTQLDDKPNEFGEHWYPVGDSISTIASIDPTEQVRVFGHMDQALLETPDKLMRRIGKFVAGMQVNLLPWEDTHTTAALWRFNNTYPHLDLIIQAHSQVLADFTPDEVVDRVKNMPADYLLLDASQGGGSPLDRQQLRPYIDAIYQAQLPINVVIAGGLEASTVPELFVPLVQEYPDISCDAESRLRTGNPGETVLDMDKVMAYLTAWQRGVAN